jgi:cysteinyl-tRNA synthetase
VLDYRPTSLQEAAAAVERIDGFIAKASAKLSAKLSGGARGKATDDGAGAPAAGHVTGPVPAAFAAAMDDDLNIPQALAALHETVRRGNTALAEGGAPAEEAVRESLREVLAMTAVLGLDAAGGGAASASDGAADHALSVLVAAQLEARAEARAAKDWAAADAIRDRLTAAGIAVEDTADGATWSLAQPQTTTTGTGA